MKIHTIITILFLITSTTVYAQKRVKVTGYVRDADGNPLELVNILVKNTKRKRFLLVECHSRRFGHLYLFLPGL